MWLHSNYSRDVRQRGLRCAQIRQALQPGTARCGGCLTVITVSTGLHHMIRQTRKVHPCTARHGNSFCMAESNNRITILPDCLKCNPSVPIFLFPSWRWDRNDAPWPMPALQEKKRRAWSPPCAPSRDPPCRPERGAPGLQGARRYGQVGQVVLTYSEWPMGLM